LTLERNEPLIESRARSTAHGTAVGYMRTPMNDSDRPYRSKAQEHQHDRKALGAFLRRSQELTHEWSKKMKRDVLWAAKRLLRQGARYGLGLDDAFQMAAQHVAARDRLISKRRLPDGRASLVIATGPVDDPRHRIDALHLLKMDTKTARELLAYRKFVRQEGREPTCEDLAVTQERFDELRRLARNPAELDRVLVVGGDELRDETLADRLTDELYTVIGWQTAQSTIERLELEEQGVQLRVQLEELKSLLSPAERRAVEGTARGVSKQAVSRSSRRAIEKMRREAQRRGWWSPTRETAPDPEQAERVWFQHRVRRERESLLAAIRAGFHDGERGRALSTFSPSTLEERAEMAAGRDRGQRPGGAVPLGEHLDLQGWGWPESAPRREPWNKEPLRNGEWAAYTGPRHEVGYLIIKETAAPSDQATAFCCTGEADGQHDRACPHRRA
jgi:hypothetical protein